MYEQAETGEGIPGKRARRLLIAVVAGVAAGLAVRLGMDAWGALGREAGGQCGGSSFSAGGCPRGMTSAVLPSLLLGCWAVPVAIGLLFAKGWDRRALVAIAAAGGLLAGQWAWGWLHGQDLAVAWTSSYDTSPDLSTVGAWTHGGSVIRVRVDGATGYDGATGRQLWSATLPGTDVACSVSGSPGTSEQAVGLIAYGRDSAQCDQLMAVDLATGRQLWASPLPAQLDGGPEGGVLAVAGGTAVVVSQEKALGLDLQSGGTKWTGPGPGEGAADCLTQQVAAAGQSLIELARCQSGFTVISLDPATGKPAWTAPVTEPTASYQIQVLSADPVVISDTLPGPQEASRVQVFGAGGRVTSSMQVSGIPGVNGPVALDTGSHDGFGVRGGVAAGLLIGIAQENGPGVDIVAFRLADGRRQWLVHLPDPVTAVRLSGSRLLLVDQSDPWPSLEAISLPDGHLRAIGLFPQDVFYSSDASVYVAGGRDIIVNLHGKKPTPPVAAITAGS